MAKLGPKKQHVPVFLGSTYEDLKEHRNAVRDTLHKIEVIVRCMEYFGSKPGSPKNECLKSVQSCKAYIGIFAMRYGNIDEETGKSITHLEYEEASRLGLPILVYLIDEQNQPILPKYVEMGEKAKLLQELKTELKKKYVVSFFTTPEDLAKRIAQDLPPILDEIEPEQMIDIGVPIGPGLKSIVRITNGSITYQNNTLNFQPLKGLTMSITNGSVERNEFGKLEAYIDTVVPFQSLQRLNEKLGLHFMRLFSESNTISVDPAKPTVFTASTNHILPQGEKVLNLLTWQEVPLPINIQVQTQTTASGHLEGNIFRGEFNALLIYRETNTQVGLKGSFQVHLA